MTRDDLIINHISSAKRPRQTLDGFCNDRMIVYVGVTVVQYDFASLGMGRRYPGISVEKFLAWVGDDVTSKTPKGSWRDWKDRKRKDNDH